MHRDCAGRIVDAPPLEQPDRSLHRCGRDDADDKGGPWFEERAARRYGHRAADQSATKPRGIGPQFFIRGKKVDAEETARRPQQRVGLPKDSRMIPRSTSPDRPPRSSR